MKNIIVITLIVLLGASLIFMNISDSNKATLAPTEDKCPDKTTDKTICNSDKPNICSCTNVAVSPSKRVYWEPVLNSNPADACINIPIGITCSGGTGGVLYETLFEPDDNTLGYNINELCDIAADLAPIPGSCPTLLSVEEGFCRDNGIVTRKPGDGERLYKNPVRKFDCCRATLRRDCEYVTS
jgi:hypothetical protein